MVVVKMSLLNELSDVQDEHKRMNLYGLQRESNYEIYHTSDSTYPDIESGYLVNEKSTGLDIGDGEIFPTKEAAQDRIDELEQDELLEHVRDLMFHELDGYSDDEITEGVTIGVNVRGVNYGLDTNHMSIEEVIDEIDRSSLHDLYCGHYKNFLGDN